MRLKDHLEERTLKCYWKIFFVYAKEIQMGIIALMLEGAFLNATAFTGVGYLANYLVSDNSSCWGEEASGSRRWEIYQAAYEKYQEDRTKLLDWIATIDREKSHARQIFENTDYAFKLYNRALSRISNCRTMNQHRQFSIRINLYIITDLSVGSSFKCIHTFLLRMKTTRCANEVRFLGVRLFQGTM